MPKTFTLPVPADFVLKRDLCSYGYFLLAPNHWDPHAQVFRRELELAGGPATLRVLQTPARRGTDLTVHASRALAPREVTEARALLARILRLDEDHAHVKSFHAKDPRWKRSGRARLMRSPTFFEDVIKTVTSCNVTWPSTVRMNERLCEVVGEAGCFPSARTLSETRPALLRARCSVGYRDARIIELAQMFVSGAIDPEWYENPATPDEDLHEALLELPGIGPYAAANIMQLLGRYHRLPLDTESLRHGKSVLKFEGNDRAVLARVRAHYAPFAEHAFRSYWFEMWEFYESKRGPAWTWERESTGKSFTAAQL